MSPMMRSPVLQDLTNMGKNFIKRQAKQENVEAKGAKACSDEPEPLPSIDYAQAKPSEEDVCKQEKDLCQMQDKVAALLANFEMAAKAEAKC